MKKYSLFITFMIVAFYMQAQQLTPSVICSASGTLSNGTTNVYWTIGETIVETMQSGNNQLSNGFQQANYIITAIKNNKTSYDIQLFPNPTNNLLNLKINVMQLKNVRFQLFDMQGKMVKEDALQNELTAIDCSQLIPAVYWLKLEDAAHEVVGTFKIVKQ
ncbi:MAG: T9SS type A sorting domain-containing protein [Saprospirales bacterium]|nr:T9SS type A sorting domain-containing protein [Saprospirales bacterium]